MGLDDIVKGDGTDNNNGERSYNGGNPGRRAGQCEDPGALSPSPYFHFHYNGPFVAAMQHSTLHTLFDVPGPSPYNVDFIGVVPLFYSNQEFLNMLL